MQAKRTRCVCVCVRACVRACVCYVMNLVFIKITRVNIYMVSDCIALASNILPCRRLGLGVKLLLSLPCLAST